jgi:hypothetical protein
MKPTEAKGLRKLEQENTHLQPRASPKEWRWLVDAELDKAML